jgi:hypothetical protein
LINKDGDSLSGEALKFLFITYGDGDNNFIEAANRLSGQARNLNLFDKVINLDKTKLQSISFEYSNFVNNLDKSNKRPFEHWSAKAFAVLESQKQTFGEFDVVLYADAGCEIPNNLTSKYLLKKYLTDAYLKGGLSEKTGSLEIEMTKLELLKYLNVSSDLIYSNQIQDTWFIMKISTENLKMCLDWTTFNNPKLKLIQDANKHEELSAFIEHRHSQSIFSLLWKMHEMPTMNQYNFEARRFGNFRGLSVPVQAIRNRTGTSQLRRIYAQELLAPFSFLFNFFTRRFILYRVKTFLMKNF